MGCHFSFLSLRFVESAAGLGTFRYLAGVTLGVISLGSVERFAVQLAVSSVWKLVAAGGELVANIKNPILVLPTGDIEITEPLVLPKSCLVVGAASVALEDDVMDGLFRGSGD